MNHQSLEETALTLRKHTATLENLQGQIFDDSYRTGSLLIFRAMMMQKELFQCYSEEKFEDYTARVEAIGDFIDEIIKSPNIFGAYFQ